MKSLLEQIRGRLDKLNKAERKVIEIILQNLQQAIRSSIAVLAQAATISKPAVNRFYRSFGMSGCPELRIQLAQSLANGTAFVAQAVVEGDGPGAYTRKVFSNTIASLDSAHKLLDLCIIDHTVDLLIRARQIHFFGLGTSASVALDTQHESFRFDLAVSAQASVLMQRMIASVAYTGDLFAVISYTGCTRKLMEVARLARENGASVLDPTAAGSPLARASTPCLDTPLPEDTDIYMPMASRTVQFTVLDVLATGMTLRRGVDFQPHLRRIKGSLVPTCYPLNEDN